MKAPQKPTHLRRATTVSRGSVLLIKDTGLGREIGIKPGFAMNELWDPVLSPLGTWLLHE